MVPGLLSAKCSFLLDILITRSLQLCGRLINDSLANYCVVHTINVERTVPPGISNVYIPYTPPAGYSHVALLDALVEHHSVSTYNRFNGATDVQMQVYNSGSSTITAYAFARLLYWK